MGLEDGTRIQLLAPVVRNRKGEHTKLLDDAKKSGYVRVRVDGIIYDLGEKIDVDKNKKHNIEIVVDRLVVKDGIEQRLSESIETVSALTGGIILVDIINGDEIVFSQNFACPDCGINIEEIEPPMFSFNNPSGACPDCMGLGVKMIIDEDIIVPNKNLSLKQGAINAMGWGNIASPESSSHSLITALMNIYDFDMDTPYKDLPKEARDAIMYGTQGKEIKVPYKVAGKTKYYTFAFEGVITTMERRYKESTSESAKEEY